MSNQDIGRTFILPDDDQYDAAAVHDRLAPRIAAARAAGRVPVLSREGIGPGIGCEETVRRGVRRILDLDDNVRAWIFLRHQHTWLFSMWQQRMKSANLPGDLTDFLGGEQGWPEIAVSWRNVLDYSRAVEQLQRMVGADKVHVELYESFQADPLAVVGRVDAFMGLPADAVPPPTQERRNTGLSMVGARRLQAIRPFTGLARQLQPRPRRLRWAVRILQYMDRVQGNVPVTQDGDVLVTTAEPMEAAFAATKQALARRCPGLDLAKHGYPGCAP